MLPNLADLEAELPDTIEKCKEQMTHTTVTFDDKLKKAKGGDNVNTSSNADTDDTNEE